MGQNLISLSFHYSSSAAAAFTNFSHRNKPNLCYPPVVQRYYVNTPPYNLIVRHNGLNVPISSLLMPKTLPYYVAFDSEIMQKSIIL